ncbi:MAG: AAA family ATPase, partial [Ignavibacteriaceae bacterium]|nr:AAA family ATPase [Ignavibacteriaceae bacterium]
MKILNVYKDTYDYIIFDTAPGRNFPALTNLIISDYFFIIVRPNLYAVLGTKNMIEETYSKTKPSSQFHSVVIF